MNPARMKGHRRTLITAIAQELRAAEPCRGRDGWNAALIRSPARSRRRGQSGQTFELIRSSHDRVMAMSNAQGVEAKR